MPDPRRIKKKLPDAQTISFIGGISGRGSPMNAAVIELSSVSVFPVHAGNFSASSSATLGLDAAAPSAISSQGVSVFTFEGLLPGSFSMAWASVMTLVASVPAAFSAVGEGTATASGASAAEASLLSQNASLMTMVGNPPARISMTGAGTAAFVGAQTP